MRIHREEAFGPVATLYRVRGPGRGGRARQRHARSASVPTSGPRDEDEQRRFARDLEAGGVFFNGMTASHPALPFGGVKRSGYGRELSGHGIREFCNITTVWYGS